MKSIDTTDGGLGDLLGDLSDRVRRLWRLFLITWAPQVFVVSRDCFVIGRQRVQVAGVQRSTFNIANGS